MVIISQDICKIPNMGVPIRKNSTVADWPHGTFLISHRFFTRKKDCCIKGRLLEKHQLVQKDKKAEKGGGIKKQYCPPCSVKKMDMLF